MEAAYACPLCGEKVDRELTLFMEHTDQHVIEAIRKKHPEWVGQDGRCERCAEYYRSQLHGD